MVEAGYYSHVEDVFKAYSGQGNTMDGESFKIMVKDLKLLDTKSLNTTDVDLIFARIKSKETGSINFTDFQIGLCLLAE